MHLQTNDLHGLEGDKLDGAVRPCYKVQVYSISPSPAHVARESTVTYAVPDNTSIISPCRAIAG